MRKAGVHVLDICTEEDERGMFPKQGTDCQKGGGQGIWEMVFTRESPVMDISMVEDKKQTPRAEVQ
jgi:hypothetical protein